MSNLVGKGSKERWYPNSMQSLRQHLSGYKINSDDFPELLDIKANVCYNLQYIEYLRKTLLELNLSEVLMIQTIKSFIVTSVSILEAYFYIICKNESLLKKVEWKEEKSISKSDLRIEDNKYRIESMLFKEIEELEYEKPTLDKLNKIIERKNLLNLDHQFFKDLNHLRKLRNKIHLQEISESGGTDYRSFWLPEYNLSKNCLRMFLLNDIFKGGYFNANYFNFLIVREK